MEIRLSMSNTFISCASPNVVCIYTETIYLVLFTAGQSIATCWKAEYNSVPIILSQQILNYCVSHILYFCEGDCSPSG